MGEEETAKGEAVSCLMSFMSQSKNMSQADFALSASCLHSASRDCSKEDVGVGGSKGGWLGSNEGRQQSG